MWLLCQDLAAVVDLLCSHAPFWCPGANLQQYGPVFSHSKGCAFCITPMKIRSSKTQKHHYTTLVSFDRIIISSVFYCHLMAEKRRSLALFSGLKFQTPPLVYITKTLRLQ